MRGSFLCSDKSSPVSSKFKGNYVLFYLIFGGKYTIILLYLIFDQ